MVLQLRAEALEALEQPHGVLHGHMAHGRERHALGSALQQLEAGGLLEV